MNLTERIKAYAQKLGFELVGVTPAEPSRMIDRYEGWLKNGYAGEMSYLDRHLPLKRDPRNLLPEARSIIALGVNYDTLHPPESLASDPARGQISRYAWGADYHEIIHAKLRQLAQFIEKTAQQQTTSKVYVDTGPILEREYAQNAGLGWIGKNTNLINWRSGSWFFLA